MKPIILFSVGWIAFTSAWAGPAPTRVEAAAVAPGPTIVPIVTDAPDPKSGGRLRDVLRQPFDASATSGQPYRLSDEERQRMREQLRGQQLSDRPVKP